MERIELKNSSAHPNFIGSWVITPSSMCDQMIQFFDSDTDKQHPGLSGSGKDYEAKKSTDITVRPKDLNLETHKPVRAYLESLNECYHDYLVQWPFLKTAIPKMDIGAFNIQRYQTGEHFKGVHSERLNLGHAHRVLVWMTYLNDVRQGGSTRFTHYDLDVQPEKGKTLIWPAEWTHAHLGNIVTEGSKYIVTGWMHFPTRE